MASPRRTALEILMRIEKDGSFSNLALDAAIGRLCGRDAALVTALIYGVLENLIGLDYWISHFAGRDTLRLQAVVRNILRLGAYQLIYMKRIPAPAAVDEAVKLAKSTGCAYAAGFVNAVLREIARNADRLPCPDEKAEPVRFLSVKYSVPVRLIEKWLGAYGRETTLGLLESLSQRPPAAVRVNTLKISPQALIGILDGEGVRAKPSPAVEGSLELDRLPDLRRLESFRRGLYFPQDYASQLCCLAVGAKAGESVLDMCAAPGGKSFTLGILMRGMGSITALELHENRLRLIKEGAKRLGLGLIKAVQNDSSKHNGTLGLYDRVLCDVPCSGLGVIRRKPEIRYKAQETFDELPQLQYSILCEGASHCRNGGTLVYSTCTLSPEENEAVAQRFLEENGDFAPYDLPVGFAGMERAGHMVTLFPHVNGTDGFFIARFRRTGGRDAG